VDHDGVVRVTREDAILILGFVGLIVAIALFGVFGGTGDSANAAASGHIEQREELVSKWLPAGKESSKHAAITEATSRLIGPSLPKLQEALAEGGGVVRLIQRTCAEQQDKVALIDGRNGNTLSYTQLWNSVSSLAQALTDAGIGRQDVVAFFLLASPELVVAALAVNSAGAAWLPLDAHMPSARYQQLLRASDARLALGSIERQELELGDTPLWLLGQCGEVNMHGTLPKPLERPLSPAVPPGTAIIIYTSGSSGTPKGVLYGTDTVLHGVFAYMQLVDMDSSSVALLKCPSIWSVIETEIYPALVAGGKIFCDALCNTDLNRFSAVLAEHHISVLNSSAPVLLALVDDIWSQTPEMLAATSKTLRHISNVGGQLPLDCCAILQGALPQTKIHNSYGVTESAATEWTYHPCGQEWRSPNAPAGVPQPEVEVHILGADMRPVALGDSGEVFFASAFNSLGYLGDRELTCARFLEIDGVRGTMYRTGDIGRLTSDPSGHNRPLLELTGRADRQFNILGVRVAPEEIEAVISSVPGVAEIAVVACSNTIVAFYRGKEPDLSQRITEHCETYLPVRMRPHVTVSLKELPKLASGKVDLKSLSAQASETAAEAMVEVVDSLGQMRQVNKEAQQQAIAFSIARGISILVIILFHWVWWDRYDYDSHAGVVPHPGVIIEKRVPAWMIWFFVGNFTSEWSMFVFVVMSAYSDRQAADEKRAGQWREVVLVLFFYVICFWPLPQICQLSSYILDDGTAILIKCAGHNWYLLLWLVCRFFSSCVFTRMEARLQNASRAARHFARAAIILVFWGMHMFSLLPPAKGMLATFPITDRPCWQVLTSFFIDTRLSAFLLAYVIVWFLGQDAWVHIKRHWPAAIGATSMSLLLVASIEFVGYCTFSTLRQSYAEKKPVKLEFESLVLFRDMLLAALVIAVSILLSQRTCTKWCGLVAMGNASLGGYVLHYFFMRYDSHGDYGLYGLSCLGIPDIWHTMDLIRPYAGGLGQIAVMLLYSGVFLLTFGLLFQKAALFTFSAVERGLQRLLNLLGSFFRV
jgi:acyl-coenzyme A synthetase/AMP-(fatty) acid ligase